jgi:predicted DNA-binding protein (MmcQ/YjbR family)
MDIENFRDYCLSFKGAKEKLPFKKATSDYDSNLLVFSVVDKWFCFVNIEVLDFCNLKCNPNESLELQEKYDGINSGYHMNKKHWISVYFNKDVPDSKIKELIKISYELVVKKLKRDDRERLGLLM